MEWNSVVFKTDNTFEYVVPQSERFTKDELEHVVGGAFYLVAHQEKKQFFVISADNSNTTLGYNINANYLYRRAVDAPDTLRGNVLLCNQDLLEPAIIEKYSL